MIDNFFLIDNFDTEMKNFFHQMILERMKRQATNLGQDI